MNDIVGKQGLRRNKSTFGNFIVS